MYENKICPFCLLKSATRICEDCLPPNTLFCSDCFSKHHNGQSTMNHSLRDIRSGAIILVKKSESHSVEKGLPDLPNLFSNNQIIASVNEKKINNINKTENVSPEFSKIEKKLDVDFSFLNSTKPEGDQCILFNSIQIKKFSSPEELMTALKLNESVDKFRFPIVTFITKPMDDNKSLANILLLPDSPVQFIEGSTRIQSPLCSVLYDSKHNILVLETQNMYKKVVEHVNLQNMLMNMLLAVSDVIVFSESNRKRDFIEIHQTMKDCESKYCSYYEKIHKSKPQLMAPGIVYVKFDHSSLIDNLSQSIEEVTGRKELFHSFTEIVNFNKKDHDNQSFIDGLTKILDNISKYRSPHSMNDLWTCVDNCVQSDWDINCSLSPDSWFVCRICCDICQVQCSKHFRHSGGHENNNGCSSNGYNGIYYCKMCRSSADGLAIAPMVLKQMSKDEMFLTNLFLYPIRGRILECNKHGIIYQEYWSKDENISTEFCHQWPGEVLMSKKIYPIGQTLVDKVNEISQPVSRLVKNSTEYISDVIQPEDWQSTWGTFNCTCCKKDFTLTMKKHHCRICKLVICSTCCNPYQSFPICESCFNKNVSVNHSFDVEPKGIWFFNIIRDTVNYSSSTVKKVVSNFTRPDYWEPDELVVRCFICEKDFHNEINPIHHCRACGKCVCHSCSEENKPVEWRCIFTPSRVCSQCINNQNWKTPV